VSRRTGKTARRKPTDIARYELGEFPVPKTVELAFKVIEEEEKR
jgi:hypothetical protein